MTARGASPRQGVVVWIVEYTCAGRWEPMGVHLARRWALDEAKAEREREVEYRARWNASRPFAQRVTRIRFRTRKAVAR